MNEGLSLVPIYKNKGGIRSCSNHCRIKLM